MATTMALRDLGDSELISSARRGDPDAYGELYRRHVDSARAAARALTRSRADADDVTSEAFARVLRALQAGGGPELAFRPYLVTAVRHVVYDRARRNREDPTDHVGDDVNVVLLDAVNRQEDGAFAIAAFASLPERWQLVLWHTEVEGRSVSEVAPMLGLAPNAVAALAYRAREGLRQAYLQAHLRLERDAACRECAEHLGAYVRDGVSARDRRRTDAHLEGCASCRGLVAELADTNTTLRVALIPALLGVAPTAYLSGLGGKGVLLALTRLPTRHLAAAGGAVAAGVLAVAVVAGAFGSDGTAAPHSPTSVVASPTGEAGDDDGADTSGVDGQAAATPAATPAATTTPATTVPTTTVPTTTVPTTAVPTTKPARVVRPATPPATGAPSSSEPPTTVLPASEPPSSAPATAPATTVPATTVPSTAVPSTTVPSTTLPVATARLTIGIVQSSPAPRNGSVVLEVTVTNNGTSALSGVRVELPAPPGSSFVGPSLTGTGTGGALLAGAHTPAHGWSCGGDLSCMLPTLPPGHSTQLSLTLFIADSAPATLTLAPAISNPAGATVTAAPITIVVDPTESHTVLVAIARGV